MSTQDGEHSGGRWRRFWQALSYRGALVGFTALAIWGDPYGRIRRLPQALSDTFHSPHVARLAIRTARFVIVWIVVWIVQWLLAPYWLVGSRTGLSTVFQTLPGVLVALFALIVASFYVLAQQTANTYSPRSVVILITDLDAGTLLLKALLLAVVPLVISGQVPDEGTPAAWVTSLAATTLLATAGLVASATNVLSGLLGSYIAPRTFVNRALEYVDSDLSLGALFEVIYKVSALTEMLRASIRRGDTVSVFAAISGLDSIRASYIRIAKENPTIRFQPSIVGPPREGWLGFELGSGLASAGDEALRVAASQEETQELSRLLDVSTQEFVKAGLDIEAREMIDAHIVLGTSPHQIRPETVNLWPQSAGALAAAEREAESGQRDELAKTALAAWALVVAFMEAHFGHEHPSKTYSLSNLGPSPPWANARALVGSLDWQRRWANKMPQGVKPVARTLDWAEREHARVPRRTRS